MKVLVTGTGSGLGKYLFEEIGGIPYNRQTSQVTFEQYKSQGVDIIIHAAFNSTKEITSDNITEYIKDNIFLNTPIT